MRSEDIVGMSFFLVLFVGLGQFLYGSSRAKGSPERTRWLSSGLAVSGFALIAFGTLTAYFIHTSARMQVEGNLWAVSDSTETSSSQFKVTDDSGQVATIRCRYSGPGLREGDRVRVRYVEYNRTLIELTMLTGSYTGWVLQESAGEWGFAWFALIGLVCAVSAYRLRILPSQVEKSETKK